MRHSGYASLDLSAIPEVRPGLLLKIVETPERQAPLGKPGVDVLMPKGEIVPGGFLSHLPVWCVGGCGWVGAPKGRAAQVDIVRERRQDHLLSSSAVCLERQDRKGIKRRNT
eukprot:1160456-Pelagomonas_calceolata.AAC.12